MQRNEINSKTITLLNNSWASYTLSDGNQHILDTYTVANAGLYLVTLPFYYSSNSTGYRSSTITLNDKGQMSDSRTSVSGDATMGTLSFARNLSSGDVIGARLQQTSGSSLLCYTGLQIIKFN